MASLLLLLAVSIAAFYYVFSSFIRLIIRQLLSPLRLLSGPPSPSFFLGNLIEMHDQENTDLVARWEQAYGSTFVYTGFVGGCRLMTTDPVAVAYILRNAYDYPKPDFVRDSLATMAAGHHGLLVVEGEDHRRQRKILTPAFSASHIKTLTPIFWKKAVELRDIWLTHPPRANIDALSWLSRATLDIIGLAGFGYSFDSLSSGSTPCPSSESPSSEKPSSSSTGETREAASSIGEEKEGKGPGKEPNELAEAFATIFSTARQFRAMTILQVWFPVLRRFRRNSKTMQKARATMRAIGLDLIQQRQDKVVEELRNAEIQAKQPDSTGAEKSTLDKDLLSVLIRSNNTTSPAHRMSSEEILSQISTFIAAGHETTASALSWCLYALAQNPRVQRKLRDELNKLDSLLPPCNCCSKSPTSKDDHGEDVCERTHPNSHSHLCAIDTPELQAALEEALSSCTYLDWVIRESLRVNAPVTSTMRECMRDEDVIPLSGPLSADATGKPDEGGYLDREGVRRWSVRLKKHDIITVPIQAINKSKRLWGDDAGVFRPERWESPPETIKLIPGLFAHTLTFLNGNGTTVSGNRGCIGWKFALAEIRIFLYVLLKDIDVTMDPSIVIEKKVNIVTRPISRSHPELGNQMPIFVRRADGQEDQAHGLSSPCSPKRSNTQKSWSSMSTSHSSDLHHRGTVRTRSSRLFATPFDTTTSTSAFGVASSPSP